MHWKIANYLCKNYKVILLPKFESQKMVMKSPGVVEENQLEYCSEFVNPITLFFSTKVINKG